MQAYLPSADDFFARALARFEATRSRLRQQSASPLSHRAVEDQIRLDVHAIGHDLYQAFLDGCSAEERRCYDLAPDFEGEVRSRFRRLESRFGRVGLWRLGFHSGTAETKADFPLDRSLNLPQELFSLPVRRELAQVAVHMSIDNAIQQVEHTTDAPVPKRQAEELLVRAAQDVETFMVDPENWTGGYAMRDAPVTG
jgi:hypothetical protein